MHPDYVSPSQILLLITIVLCNCMSADSWIGGSYTANSQGYQSCATITRSVPLPVRETQPRTTLSKTIDVPANPKQGPSEKIINAPSSNSDAQTDDDIGDSALDVLAGNIAICLHKSDLRRDDGFDGASTGWTSWVDGEAALRLQSCMDALEFPAFIRNPKTQVDVDTSTLENRDEAVRWIRWIKACPSPLIMELSPEIRQAVNATIPNEQFLNEITSDRNDFLQRIGCRLIILPSGSSLTRPLRAPPGAMIYGKLLLGGVTRFRMIGSSSRTDQDGELGLERLLHLLRRQERQRGYNMEDRSEVTKLSMLVLAPSWNY